MKTIAVLAVFLFVAVTTVSAVRIRNCGSKAQVSFADIKITGCSPKLPHCIFKKNQTAHLSIPFAPKSQVTSLKAVVHGIIAGIPVPFSLKKPEACGESLKCPVAPGTSVTYFEGLPVKASYPTMNLNVKWALVDQAGVTQVCIIIPVRLE